MLTLLGILLLVAGASLTFAVDRQVDGVDVQLAGWILLAGGALASIVAMIRAAAVASAAGGHVDAPAGNLSGLEPADRAAPDVDVPDAPMPERTGPDDHQRRAA